MNTLMTPIPSSSADQNDIPLIGDQFEEQELEEEEARLGDNRDVLKDIPGMDGHEKVMPTADELPEGMETAIRGSEGEDIETAGEDEETGNDDI